MAPEPTKRKHIGMLTPSSNTVLEPVTAAMLAGLPDVSAHFGRFRVTEISLGEKALAQFDDTPILAAAELLADARAGAIVWNGTSASWLGLDTDRRLCGRIEERTGAKAGTSVLALMELFRAFAVKRYGLVTPYLDDVQGRIVANFEREGLACAAERHHARKRELRLRRDRRGDDRANDPRGCGREARRDRHPVHQYARRQSCGRARTRTRHSDFRHGRDRRLDRFKA